MEELKENFVLLSKVAKVEKYAQEYLGLLARRGDIGSIRIGKRWYTTQVWFKEFLENSQKKKSESVVEEKIQEPAKVELEKVITVQNTIKQDIETGAEEIKISLPLMAAAPVNLKTIPAKYSTDGSTSESRIKISLPSAAPEQEKVSIVQSKMAMKKIRVMGEIRVIKNNTSLEQNKKFIKEKKRYAIPYPEIKIRKNEDVFSPVFMEDKQNVSFVPKLVFAFSFALMLVLVAVSGYMVWSGGLLEKGRVAGASDERSSGFSDIKSEGDQYLVGAGDKMKESLSISRVIVEVAKEKAANSNQ